MIANIRRGMNRSSKTWTCDFVLPRHTRYQLRYTPKLAGNSPRLRWPKEFSPRSLQYGSLSSYHKTVGRPEFTVLLHQCHPLSVCSIGCCYNTTPEHTIVSSGLNSFPSMPLGYACNAEARAGLLMKSTKCCAHIGLHEVCWVFLLPLHMSHILHYSPVTLGDLRCL